MNPLALLIFFLIGILSDWGNAFWALGGYLLAFVIVGYWRGRGKL